MDYKNLTKEALPKEFQERPELVPYIHGCLAQLVGDEGYHDNRSDIPKL